MKLKILRKYPDGTTEVEEIVIETFRWEDNHKFQYVPIYDGYSTSRFLSLEQNEDILGLII